MKSLFFAALALTALAPLPAFPEANDLPTAEAPYLRLRKSPTFGSDFKPLAAVWGPAIPMGAEFQIEKSYGRWVYGHPLPLPMMKAKDRAANGWVYNRMLVPPGDASTRSRELEVALLHAEHYAEAAWKELHLNTRAGRGLYLSFLNNLVLSEATLKAFANLDEAAAAGRPGEKNGGGTLAELAAALWPNAHAAAEAAAKPASEAKTRRKLQLGFAGANLNFLQVEAETKRRERAHRQAQIVSKILQPPVILPAGDFAKAYTLGRYIAEKNLDLPELSHEEVDGHLYLRAVTTRALRACPEEIQVKWKHKHFSVFRAKALFGRPSGENLWFQLELPGGQFFHSDQVLRAVDNEAELAFVLIRPLVMSLRASALTWEFGDKWIGEIPKLAANAVSRIRLHQSVQQNPGLDVSDEIAADFIASQCIANAGYMYNSGLAWLTRMRASRKAGWAAWFVEGTVGLDYRLEQLATSIPKGVADGRLKNSATTNPLRFRAAQKLWNI